MILGLDISTSITGYTILDDNGLVVECDHVDLKNFEDTFSKAENVDLKLNLLFQKYKIESVWIEESLQKFSMGKSSAKTLATLTKFNGIVSWIIYDRFAIQPKYLPAISARKLCGIKVEKGKKGKEFVMEHMKQNESWFQIEHTKKDNIKNYCYDRADSWVMARAGYLKSFNK
jgi:Holliday junction resolvasome RuvABC endonuclease subunit